MKTLLFSFLSIATQDEVEHAMINALNDLLCLPILFRMLYFDQLGKCRHFFSQIASCHWKKHRKKGLFVYSSMVDRNELSHSKLS